MNGVIIHDTTDYILVSYGNGWAYAFFDRRAGAHQSSLWLQDDDATQFRTILNGIASREPERSYNSILGE